MILTILWIWTALMPSTLSFGHDFHLSKCDINFSEEENTLQIGIHLFIDDLEEVLRLGGHENLNLCTDKEVPDAENIVFSYLNSHVRVMNDDIEKKVDWIGKEISDDLAGIWCYLEISEVKPESKLMVENTLLLELFDDQRNIVKVTSDHKRISYFLFDSKEFQGFFEI